MANKLINGQDYIEKQNKMLKIFYKLFSFFACVISLVAIVIAFWAYFVVKKATLDVFIIVILFFGFAFVFESYNLFKNNSYFKLFLSTDRINPQTFLLNLGSLIFSGLCFYLGIAAVEDVSAFDKKLFLFGGFFFFILPFSSFWMTLKGFKRYDALPREKKDEMERRILSLDKTTSVFAFLTALIVLIVYFLVRM